MPDRNAQAGAVTVALAQWVAASQKFDDAHQADIVAMAVSNAASRAANQVAWKLAEHSGATRQEVIAAEQLALAAEDAKSKYESAFQATAAASQARNDARAALLGAVNALDETGEVENMAGTAL